MKKKEETDYEKYRAIKNKYTKEEFQLIKA